MQNSKYKKTTANNLTLIYYLHKRLLKFEMFQIKIIFRNNRYINDESPEITLYHFQRFIHTFKTWIPWKTIYLLFQSHINNLPYNPSKLFLVNEFGFPFQKLWVVRQFSPNFMSGRVFERSVLKFLFKPNLDICPNFNKRSWKCCKVTS